MDKATGALMMVENFIAGAIVGGLVGIGLGLAMIILLLIYAWRTDK